MKKVFLPARKKTVLIIDHDPLVARVFEETLQRGGFSVVLAGDRNGAMQQIETGRIGLVLLDLSLSGIDAIELLESIRARYGRQLLPVFVFANPFLGKMERAALNSGATRSLIKTEIKPEAMLELARTLLASEPGENKTNEKSTGESDGDIYERLMATVSAKLPELLAQVRLHYQTLARTEGEEARKFELNALHRQVHLLAGAAGLSGRPRIAQMALALEALAGELRDKPAQMTPSVLRTAAQAIDTLNFLIAVPPNSAAGSSSSPKILAVDDDRIAQQMISSALGKARLTARTLDDPVSAEVLLKNEAFDLIFLDVEMPGHTGLDLCMKIREMPLHRATPVVFVTSHSDFGSRAQSTLSGGNDFIAKPFLQVELVIKALIHLFKRNFRPAPSDQRSTSPMTMSTDPSMTMTSATV